MGKHTKAMNEKNDKTAPKILKPDVRVLFYSVLIFWSLITIFSAFLFTLKGKDLAVFIKIWYIVPVLFAVYWIYGYGRLLVLKLTEAKRDGGIFYQIKTNKKFRSVFSTALGIIVSFAFAAMYCANGFMSGSGFYWFLAEFYLVAAILKLYLNTVVGTEYSRNDAAAYVVVYCVSVFMAVAIAGATFYVVFFDGIFEKNGYLVAFISLFVAYKICSAVRYYHISRINKSKPDSAKSLVELSSALFSVFTLCVALMIMITKNPLMKHFSYLGFGFAIVIFIMAIAGLIKSCKLLADKKRALKADNEGK